MTAAIHLAQPGVDGSACGLRQADVFALLRGSGRLVGLEVKTARGTAEPHQLAWGATVTAAGGVYAVVMSAEDARAVIDRACDRPA